MRLCRPFQIVVTCGILACATSHVAFAQRDLKDIPVPDPDLERRTFKVPEGFEVNLFAADPTIAKPIQMNFDESGRLWIVSSEVYPHIEPGASPSDRVVVLEDLDGDGTSDKTHVFAEGLLIPTGVAPGDGGVYVANSTELLHFADANNDLRADSRRVVLSGFGTEDTHHILHTLRWGPDGYLYFNQSIYIHSHIETPWGVRRLNAGGIWQFRPETSELGIFMRGLVNSWGHHFDRFGQSFATDGAGGEGINYIVPGAYYFTAADAPRIVHGLNPGSPKHCGLEVVETPMLPPDWQGSAITNDFRGHRVCRFNLSEDRSGYLSREQQEVISSDHVAFRPIDVKLGPDGAIYIADWYNPIIQHGEVDFRDPRRDHTHGRIWRVSWKGAPKRDRTNIAALSNTELLQTLRSSDNFQRQAAKQVIRQRGESALADLKNWHVSIPVNPETEHLRLEALWCYQCLRRPNVSLLTELLTANDGRVRAAATRVLSHWAHLTPDASGHLKNLVNDKHARVRLEAVRSISFSPNRASEEMSHDLANLAEINTFRSNPELIEIALQATSHPTDAFIDYAVWLTARELSQSWLPAFKEGTIDFDNNLEHLLTAFSAVGEGAPLDFLLLKLYADTTTQPQRTQVVNLVTTTGSTEQIRQLVIAAVGKEDADTVNAALAAARSRKNMQISLPDNAQMALLSSESPQLRAVGLKAAGQWHFENFQPYLTDIASQKNNRLTDRMAACEGLALAGGKANEDFLNSAVYAQEYPITLRKHATALLTGLKPGRGAAAASELFSTMNLTDNPEQLIPGFMLVKNGDKALATALETVELKSNVARELLRSVRESGRAAPELEAALKAAGKIASRKEISADDRAALLKMAKEEVTAAEGEKVFRTARLSCLKCHAIGGAGGKVGPDMVSLGGSAQPDYLLESLLNPNAKIKENYHTIVVATIQGKVISGVQVKRSKEAVVLRTAHDELITIPETEIDEIAQGVSLMPEGQVDALTDREIAALVRFLSELGRSPEYTISRRQFARTWDVMAATKEAAFRLRRTSYATAAVDDAAFSWTKGYSEVSGLFPLENIPVVSIRNRSAAGSRGVGFVRCYLNVETAGTVALALNTVDGIEVRLNELPVDAAKTMEMSVTPGVQRLTFTVDQTNRTDPLELELLPVGTTAVAAFAN